MTDSNQKLKNSLLKKRWVRIVISIVVLTIIIFVTLPVATKLYLADWLEKNGADTAQIESMTFNPFTTRLTIKGVDVVKGGQSLLKNSTMVVDIGLPSLLNRDIRVEKAEYVDLSLDLEQFADGIWRIGSVVIPNSKEDKLPQPEKAPSPRWGVLTDHLLLSNCTVKFKTPKLNFNILIKKGELQKFTTHENEREADLTLEGEMNNKPFTITLEDLQIRPSIKFTGEIYVKGFQLSDLGELLSETLPVFTGTTDLEGKAVFAMEDDGGMSVEYDGMINLAKGHIGYEAMDTSADNLAWKGGVQYSQKVAGAITIKTDGSLSGNKFNLQLPTANFTTSEAIIDFTGKTEVLIEDNVAVVHDGSLLVEEILVELPEQAITEKQLMWQGRSQYDSKPDEKGFIVKTDGDLKLGPVNYDNQASSGSKVADVEGVSWQGAVRVGEQSDKSLLLEVDGSLITKQLMASLSEPQLQILQESLSLKTNTSVGFGENLKVEGQSSLDLNTFTLSAEQDNKPLISLDTLSIKDLVAGENNQIRVSEISAERIESNVSGGMPLEINVSQIQMQNLLVDQFTTLSSEALVVENTSVQSSHNGKGLAELQQVKLNNIHVDGDKRVAVEDAVLSGFNALAQENDSENHAVSLDHAVIKNLLWDSALGVTGDQVKLENLQAVLARDKDGELTVNTQLKDMQQSTSVPESEEDLKTAETKPSDSEEKAGEDVSKGVAIKLQQFIATGENNIVFEDYSLAVPYKTDLVIHELEATDIDSSNSENQIKLLLKGEFEKRAPLELTGTLSPFGEKTVLDLGLSLKNYPLSSLSAYTVQSVGTALSEGQLKIKSDIQLADNVLDMKNKVDLRKLKTETISPELAAELNNELPIPLDAALALLRDSKDDISLSIPFSGPLGDLNVGISDVLITALSKAIVPAASGYLMYTLGPYGALAYVGAKVGEKMLEVKLPPVEFGPKMFDITEAHTEYLERIGAILTDRPQMDLQICPQVLAWELLTEEQKAAVTTDSYSEPIEKEREELLALGQDRAVAIQTYLAQKHGIDITRLLICDTLIKRDKKSVPQVELQL